MKKTTSVTTWLLALAIAPACGDDGAGMGTDTSDDTGDTSGECVVDEEVPASITEDTVWECDKILPESTIVTVSNGAVLTVAPGVTVRGKTGSALVIAQGSRLEAAGTKEEPIVFTSSQAEGSRNRGDWGGIVLLGKASTNLQGGVGQAEGLEEQASYGGGSSVDAAHSCGTLKWLRVEFAGFELTMDNELNGIGFYSCGTGTTVEYVQSHMGDDDGIEMFGGGFDAKHLVVTGAGDDAIDSDQGFIGTLQYVFIQQDPTVGNYAFEWSNQDVTQDATPRSKPVVCNVTAIGTGAGADTKSSGVKLKEGASGEVHSSIFTNFNKAQIDLTEGPTEAQATAGAIALKNNIFFDNALDGSDVYVISDGSTFDLKGFVEAAANANHVDVDPKLGSIAWGSPDIVPAADSPALGAGAAGGSCEAVDYIGAVKDAAGDWTTGWTNFKPN